MADRCFLCDDQVGELRPGYCDTHAHLVRKAIAKMITSEPPDECDCYFPGCLEKAEPKSFLCTGHRVQREKGLPLTPLGTSPPKMKLKGAVRRKADDEVRRSSDDEADNDVRKPLVGQHLMRVRIRKVIFDRLQELAEEQTERIGEHVTVSDLVRGACFNYLLAQEAVKRLENAPYDFDDEEELEEDEEEGDEEPPFLIILNPMLS